MHMFDMIFSILGVLVGVAFFTLMERKFMGYFHYRKGPNKISVFGMLQPFSDAIKLLMKESINSSSFKLVLFYTGPMMSILCMLLCWIFFDYYFLQNLEVLKIFFILVFLSLSFYGLLFMSWGSNSKYTLMGGLRGLAQVISYEVCLVLLIFFPIYLIKSYSLNMISLVQEGLPLFLLFLPIFLTWFTICLAEANRSPFDISEGESEIVSGFNIEYGGGLFALIFISEYGMMIFMGSLTIFLLMGAKFFLLKLMVLCYMFVWLRCSFPRCRYDMLMTFAWKYLIMMSCVLMVIVL